MFLQTAGATLALPLVGGGAAFAQKPAGPDPVLAELARQARAAAHTAARSATLVTGETARQAANALRLLAAQATASGLDKTLDAALRTKVAREGRHAVLAARPADAAALAARLGLDLDRARLGALPDDYAARAAALDVALQRGVAHTWRAVAQELEAGAARLDTLGGVRLVRQSPADCGSGQWALFMLEVTMFMACGPWAVLIEPCVIAAGAYFTYRLALMIMGCI